MTKFKKPCDIFAVEYVETLEKDRAELLGALEATLPFLAKLFADDIANKVKEHLYLKTLATVLKAKGESPESLSY